MSSDAKGVIKIIRSLVISSDDCDYRTLTRDYRDEMGEPIPFRRLGYGSLDDFLRASGEFRLVETSSGVRISATASQDSAHISDMRANQTRAKKPAAKRRPAPPPPRYNYARHQPTTSRPPIQRYARPQPAAVTQQRVPEHTNQMAQYLAHQLIGMHDMYNRQQQELERARQVQMERIRATQLQQAAQMASTLKQQQYRLAAQQINASADQSGDARYSALSMAQPRSLPSDNARAVAGADRNVPDRRSDFVQIAQNSPTQEPTGATTRRTPNVATGQVSTSVNDGRDRRPTGSDDVKQPVHIDSAKSTAVEAKRAADEAKQAATSADEAKKPVAAQPTVAAEAPKLPSERIVPKADNPPPQATKATNMNVLRSLSYQMAMRKCAATPQPHSQPKEAKVSVNERLKTKQVDATNAEPQPSIPFRSIQNVPTSANARLNALAKRLDAPHVTVAHRTTKAAPSEPSDLRHLLNRRKVFFAPRPLKPETIDDPVDTVDNTMPAVTPNYGETTKEIDEMVSTATLLHPF